MVPAMQPGERQPAGEGGQPADKGEAQPPSPQLRSQTVVLIRDAGDGDPEAFAQLYKKNRAWLCATAALLIGEHLARVDVEDLLQETFLYAFRKIQKGEFKLDQSEGAFRHYLTAVLRHKAVDAARRAKAKKRGEGREKAMRDLYTSTISELGLLANEATPSQCMMKAELASGMRHAIASLNEQDRLILHYRLVCRLPYEEILPHLTMVRGGKALLDEDGKPVPVTKVGTAKSMFSRARQKLLALLKTRGLVGGSDSSEAGQGR